MLSSPQRRLLRETNVSISWATPHEGLKHKSFNIGNQSIVQAVKVLCDVPNYVDLSAKEALEKYNDGKLFFFNELDDLATIFAGVRSAGDIVLNSGLEDTGLEEPDWWNEPPANLDTQQRANWKPTPWSIDHPNNEIYPGLRQVVKNIESLGHSVVVKGTEYKYGIFIAHKDSGLTADDVLNMRPVERGITYGYPPEDVRTWAKHHGLD